MSKILVAYFSPTGTTKRAAQDIAKALEADLYEIRPETPYTSGDLNWMDEHSRSTVEMAATTRFSSASPSGGTWSRKSWTPSSRAATSPASA